MKKRLLNGMLAAVLCLALVFGAAACGGGGDDGGTQSPPEGTEGDAPAGGSGTYHIGYLNFGPDWILNRYAEEAQEVALIANPDNNFQIADGGFMADKMTTEIQSLLASGAQALCYDAHFETMLTDTIAKCKQAGAALLIAHIPTFPERYEEIRAYDKFVGYFGSDLYKAGYQLGEQAAKDGGKKCIIASGAKGTIDMNGKIDGFTEGFTKGGGEILEVITTTLPTEVEGRVADSLAAHPDCDTIYGTTGAHTLGSLSAAGKSGRDLLFYSSDLDPDLTQMVIDGKIKAGDAGSTVEWALGMTMLINFLDGHPVLDDDGQAPIIDWMYPLLVTKDNAQAVLDGWIAKHPMDQKMVEHFLWAKNPDISYQDYKDFADNYTVDWFLDFKKQFE
ncbi:MAG: sugar ABC transporter substrate-binding protein [Clostridiales Family XIII bacterium]|jgi:ribose transport system substrate-binding protein|nr:sugar ABC transporter substrate-binding protein [Clostridiales Family XIII bacterium]